MSDLLTELQRHLRDVNDQFATVIEQIVQNAPPATLDGDPVRTPEETAQQAELQAKAQELSRSLVQSFKDITGVIDKLPDLSEPPEQQDARINGLLREHHALRQELGGLIQEAEKKLEQVHATYDILSQHALNRAGKTGGG